MTRLTRPVRRTTGIRPSHAIAELVITLYPGGIVGLRELRRRKEYTMDASILYARAAAEEARSKQGRA